MKMDLLICNATLLNLDSGREALCDVGVRQGRIEFVQPAWSERPEAREVVDAQGDYLFPGLIDLHVHLYRHGSGFGMDADCLLEAGVTTAVEMGSAGYANYPAMRCCDLTGKKIAVKSFINLSPVGQPGKGIQEPLNDEVLDTARIRELMRSYPGEICGIKVRISRPIVGELGLKPLRRAVETGEALGLPVCVHTTDPPETADKVVSILRPGDIYSHMYHGKGNTVLDETGGVLSAVLQAQRNGVCMEVGNGKMNFSFPVAEKAIAGGLVPDIISSDSTFATFHRSGVMWDLPCVMSKFLALGVSLPEVIRAVTETPARCIGAETRIGRIAPGCDADLTLCRMLNREILFEDADGNTRKGNRQLKVMATIRSGEIVYRCSDEDE